MLGLGISVGGGKSGGSGGDVSPPAWPLSASNILRIHPDMEWDGTTDDVTSITFPNGLVMLATGTGAPITKDESGFHFWMGKYFSYTPPAVVPYSGIAAYARITRIAIPNDPHPNNDAWSERKDQQPLGVVAGSAKFLFIRPYYEVISCDMGGGVDFYLSRQSEIGGAANTREMTLGAYYSTIPEEQEHGGASALWLNDRIAHGNVDASQMAPTEWVVGKDMYGTMYEGVLLTQRLGADHALFPVGTSSQWIMDQLSV